MLGKLMKYELRATARYFLPLYGAILVLSMLMGIRGFGEDFGSILNIILPSALALSFVGLSVLTLIMVVKRFDSNLMGEEGYLMFTLPVPSSSLILSKLLTALIWVLTSTFVFFLSLKIAWVEFSLSELLKVLATAEIDPYFLMIFALLLLMAAIQFFLHVYASLGIAQAYSITKSRILGGILVFIVIAIGINVLDTLLSSLSARLIGEYQLPYLSELMDPDDFPAVFSTLEKVMTYSLAYLVIKNTALYFLTKHHLEKKLNLE